MMPISRLISFLFLLAGASLLQAQEPKTVRIATYPNYEPFCFYLEQADQQIFSEIIPANASSKIFTGLAWQVVLKSFQQENYQIELFIVPWPRAYSMLEKGEVDAIFPAIKTPLREEQFSFSEQTVYPPNPLVFYQASNAKKENPAVLDTLLERLPSLKIGTIRGFSYGSRWNKLIRQHHLDPILFSNLKQGFDMLESHRIDVLPGYQLAHDYYLQKENKMPLFVVSSPFDIAYSYLMFNNYNPKFLPHFNSGRKKLQQSGQYQKLRDDWKM